MKHTIIVIDDDITLLESLEIELNSIIDKSKYTVETCISGSEAIELSESFSKKEIPIALIICDYIMPGIRGDSLLSMFHSVFPDAMKIMLTGHLELESITNAINNAALYRYIPKPWDKHDFDLAIIEALKNYEYKIRIQEQKVLLERQNQELLNLNFQNQQKQEQLKLAVENSGMFSWELGITKHFYIDDAIYEYIGIEKTDDKENKYDLLDYLFPEDRKEILNLLSSKILTREIIQFDIRVNSPSGKTFWFYARGKFVKNDKDATKSIMTGICFDITEEKEKKELLQDNEAKYKHLYEDASLGVIRGKFICDNANNVKDLELIEFNSATELILSMKSKDIIGKCLSDFISPIDSEYIDFLQSVYKTGSQTFAEFYLEGIKKFIHVIGNLYNSNKDEIIIIMYDLSKHYYYEEEIRKAKEIAEESDKMKTAFLANMSHEIRTPLNQIMGFSQLLSRRDLTEDERDDYTAILLRNSTKLLQLVTDVIDISRVEANQLKISETPLSLNHVMQELYFKFVDELKVLDKDKINFFTTKPLTDEGSALMSDESRLIQILTNLLDNAVKFTSEGYIEFGYSVNSTNTLVSIYIKDTGIGIRDDSLERIFEQFWQEDASFTRRYEGTGIGLAVCRSMTKLLGGDIMVQSEFGKGSTFTIVIPFVQPEF